MAKYRPVPNSLKEADKLFIRDAIVATEQVFKGDLFDEINEPLNKPYTTPDGQYHWDRTSDLFKDVLQLTDTENIKEANRKLYETLSTAPEYSEGTTTMTEAPEYPVSKTTLTSSESEELIGKMEEKETERAEVIEKSDAAVRAAIERKKEIYAEQMKAAKAAEEKFKKEDKTVYVEEKSAITKDQQTKKEEFAQEIQKNPVAAVNTIANDIKSRVADEVSDEAIQATAIYIVANNLPQGKPSVQGKIAENLAKNPQDSVWASPLADQSADMHKLAQMVAERAYGKEFNQVFLPDTKVEVSDAPKEGFVPVSLSPLPTQAFEQASAQKAVLDKGSLDRPAWMQSWLDKQLASVKGGGIQGAETNYQEFLVQGYLTTYKPGPKIDPGEVTTQLNLASGASEPLKLVGIAGGVAKQAITKAAISKITTTIGTAVEPGVGTAIGAVAGWIADHIDFKRLKKYSALIIGGISALLAAPFVGIGGALAIGVGATVVSFGMGAGLGAVTLGSIGYSVGGFIGAISGAILGSVLVPVLMALLAFPLFVALILFIINSGAYVVPPSPLTVNVFGNGVNIECTDKKGPVGVPGPSSSSPIANRAWEISYDLYQGFWCFWNRSPKAPPQYFPNDTLKYPPGYPNLFDYQLFLKSPNISEGAGPNLFWCTWLPVKAYQENGNKIAAELYVPNMYNDFKSRGKIVEASKATPQNIPPGSVVFFQVTSGEFSNRLNHVGVVYSVDPGGMVVVESNNAIKSESIDFRPGGGAGSLPGMLTKYFGLP